MGQQAKVKVLGVDIFVEAPLNVSLPKTIGPFSLKHVSSRGSVISAGGTDDILDVGWVCARYLFTNEASQDADKQITDLITEIGSKYSWSSLMKLYEHNGQKAFS